MSQRPANDMLLRSVGGVLIGYVVLASIVGAIVPIILRAAFSDDDLFLPNTFRPTALFISVTLGLAAIAGFCSGYVCRMVAKLRKPVIVFATIVGIMSFFGAILAMTVPNDFPNPRTGQETPEIRNAQMVQQQPAWLKIAQPVLLIVGISLGGSRFKRHS